MRRDLAGAIRVGVVATVAGEGRVEVGAVDHRAQGSAGRGIVGSGYLGA